MKRQLKILLCTVCALLCVLPGFAAEVPADGTYVFTGTEFSADGATPDGVFVRAVPDTAICLLCLGNRVIRAGDVLTAAELSQLCLQPTCDENVLACFDWMPIANGELGAPLRLNMQIKSTKNEAPTAEDLTFETYKNIANEGVLRASDPEGELLRYQLESKPQRGTVTLEEGGTFVYTPKKNKVGEDSFTYSAVDLAGNVSNTATVRVTIRQPLDAETFDDLSRTEQFPAMWMREQGLYGGQRMTDKLCFCPEDTVTRGEFLAMAMELAGIEPDVGLETQVFVDQAEAANWLRPYLCSAMRRGIAKGIPCAAGLEFRPNEPITSRDAAAILARTFGTENALPVGSFEEAPAQALTRGEACEMLYFVVSG